MKKEIHPDSRPTCFVDVSTAKKFYTLSTVFSSNKAKNKEKEIKDGVEYAIYYCDVTSDSHPAYTGKKRFVDTAGRVEQFQNKFRKRVQT